MQKHTGEPVEEAAALSFTASDGTFLHEKKRIEMKMTEKASRDKQKYAVYTGNVF